jgi:hypothetical protein
VLSHVVSSGYTLAYTPVYASNSPSSLAVGWDNNLYITDSTLLTITKITMTCFVPVPTGGTRGTCGAYLLGGRRVRCRARERTR